MFLRDAISFLHHLILQAQAWDADRSRGVPSPPIAEYEMHYNKIKRIHQGLLHRFNINRYGYQFVSLDYDTRHYEIEPISTTHHPHSSYGSLDYEETITTTLVLPTTESQPYNAIRISVAFLDPKYAKDTLYTFLHTIGYTNKQFGEYLAHIHQCGIHSWTILFGWQDRHFTTL